MKKDDDADKLTNEVLTCGIVMPISALDNCSEQHWTDVYEILQTSIEAAGFRPNLVSNADEVGIIQKRIIQNLYDNPVIVCDVSGKNPNVMFELGMRLAFDKPTIIVKDDKTSYSFDTAPIEHLEYPRDLRYAQIVEFKEELARKISSTHKKALEDQKYTTFLKNFGTFTVAKLDTKEVDKEEFILDELKSIRQQIANQNRPRPFPLQMVRPPAVAHQELCLRKTTHDAAQQLATSLTTSFNLPEFKLRQIGPDHFHITFPACQIPIVVKQGMLNSAVREIPTVRWLGRQGAPNILPAQSDTPAVQQ